MACEAGGAVAHVEALPVLARRPVLAGPPVTRVDTCLAVGAREPVPTPTRVVVDAVHADPAVHAGGGGAVVVVLLAVPAREPAGTRAGVGVDIVFAECSVSARI